MSEAAAYDRITAARALRRFPIIVEELASGALTLTSIRILAPHLTDNNHRTLLGGARYKGKRHVEELVAGIHAQPDIPSSLRRLPDHSGDDVALEPVLRGPAGLVDSPDRTGQAPHDARPAAAATDRHDAGSAGEAVASSATPVGDEPISNWPASVALTQPDPPAARRRPDAAWSARRPPVAPLGSGRYLLRVTLTAEAHCRFTRARDLLRHSIPSGDPALIVDRAMVALIKELERSKFGAASKRQARGATADGRPTSRSRGRHIPAGVRREVWTRDRGQCAFVGTQGRCTETGFLEFHHVVPFARGGATETRNIELRCRAHNRYEAERDFGPRTGLHPTSSQT